MKASAFNHARAFQRSPHVHAKILEIDATDARRLPGVIAVVAGLRPSSWVGVLSHLKGLKCAPQHVIAIGRVCRRGEAVAAIVATSRRGRGRGGSRQGSLWGAGCGDGHARRARSGNPCHSFLAGRQRRLRASPRRRHSRCGVRRFRRGGGSGVHLRTAYRPDAGAARGSGRLEWRRGKARRWSS
jgi:hypothetical protein